MKYGFIGLDPGQEKEMGSAQLHPLGTKGLGVDSRVYKYGLAGAVNIAAGTICQAALGIGHHDSDLVVTAAGAVGAKSVALTLGATAATKDQYKDGYLFVNDGAGEGHVYKIRQHDAIAASGSGTINLYDGDGLAEAITTSSEVGLMQHEMGGVLVAATTVTGGIVGIAATEITAAYYGWWQTEGLAAVLCDVAFVLGRHVRTSDNTAGSGEPLNRVTGEVDITIGIAALIAPATTEYGMVQLNIG
jgi:hypothetical protein